MPRRARSGREAGVSEAAVWLLGLFTAMGILAPGSPAHGEACAPQAGDRMAAQPVCQVAAAGLLASGLDPAAPFDWSRCASGPCRSNLGELMSVLRCESGLDPRAYQEGWVGRDWSGQPVWNRSRGIAQLGDGWGHLATDAEAFSWRWSVWYLATNLSLLWSYPECGPD